MDVELLAAEGVHLEADAVGFRDADEDEAAAGGEEVEGLVDGFLLAGAFEDEVHAKFFAIENVGDDVLLGSVGGPAGTHFPGDGEAIVEQVGGVNAQRRCGLRAFQGGEDA